MSLPACQQRVLNHIEGALRASDPRLASMYTMFASLNEGEPVKTESLTRVRLRRHANALCAIMLIPVMFAMIAIGALLGGSARGATTCGVSHSGVRGAPWASQVPCPPRKATEVKTSLTGQLAPAPGHVRNAPGRKGR